MAVIRVVVEVEAIRVVMDAIKLVDIMRVLVQVIRVLAAVILMVVVIQVMELIRAEQDSRVEIGVVLLPRGFLLQVQLCWKEVIGITREAHPLSNQGLLVLGQP
mmetsp:Transcript_22896/g.32320  ORF Transcript_22896/g.32320 Transcript_22896/m.32320 type:complete len:104 (+) Transcript_22896:78-389(+)